jgi:hypothetical protein
VTQLLSAVIRLPDESVGPPADQLPAVITAVDAVHVIPDTAPALPVALDAQLLVPGRYRVAADGTGTLTLHPACARPGITLLHEIGHYLDHAVFGDGARWGSTGERFNAWRNGVASSGAVERLRAFVVSPPVPELARAYSYLLLQEELWARSYAQWVAVRSGHDTLLDELGSSLSALSYPEQWGFEDFAPIADEIDAFFEEMT